MSRTVRLVVFGIGGTLLGLLLVVAFTGLPRFGTQHHPYGARAVHAALDQRQTANTVSSVNFDQRAIDTLGEEFILFAAVIATVVLLREMREEVEDADALHKAERASLRVLESSSLLTYVMLAVTTLVGLYVVAHGQLSPGGGFQGGVVLATGVHLLYVGGGYLPIKRARPVVVYDVLESLAAGSFAVLGLAGTALTGALLANVVPLGRLNDLLSGGTVPILNAIVGMEVAAAVTVVLARFLEQYVEVRARGLVS
jgi:multicomponent Na+:H+ antiporter subunit B